MKPIEPLERKSLKQQVIQEIKRYIIDNQLKHGDKLPTERKLMEMFGVSRSVIREALSYLENTAVINTTQGRGAFLNESNIDTLLSNFFFLWQINGGSIDEILGLRVLFESSAIDEIIKNENKDDLAELQKIVSDSKNLSSMAEFNKFDSLFHKKLLKSTNNRLFIQMTNMITTYFFQAQDIDLTTEEYEQVIEEHTHIVKALKNKDADLAKQLLTKHIQNTRV